MPRREQVVNKLRELGYKYKGETENTQKWGKGTHRVYVPKNEMVEEDWARATLRQCGATEAEIVEFIRLCNS